MNRPYDPTKDLYTGEDPEIRADRLAQRQDEADSDWRLRMQREMDAWRAGWERLPDIESARLEYFRIRDGAS